MTDDPVIKAGILPLIAQVKLAGKTAVVMLSFQFSSSPENIIKKK